jgi:ferredoxin
MPKVTFVYGKEKKEVEVPEGANLREEARKAGVPVYTGIHRVLNCRGLGLCGTCRVLVKQGGENLSPRSKRERIKLALSLAIIGHEDEMRLSCQTRVLGDCTVEMTPPFNWSGENFWQKPYPNK